MGPVPLGPDLFSLLEDAKTWSLRMIKAGETNVKCFLLMSIVHAQMQNRMQSRMQGRDEFEYGGLESQSVMVKATEEAEETCLAILQEMAVRGQTKTGVDDLEPVSLSMPSELMEDANFMVST